MQRFFIFPPLFAVWFLAGQVGLMVLSWAGLRAAFYFFPSNDPFFFITSRIHPSSFTPAIVVGAVVGCVFAALDFALNRKSKTPGETLLQLLQSGIESGIVAVILILLCQGILIALAAQRSHSRYHAYPPDIEWLNLIRTMQPLLLLASVLWAVGRTLKNAHN